MQPGVPGDVYCPNDDCFAAEQREAREFYASMREARERAELARLKAKYEAIAPPPAEGDAT